MRKKEDSADDLLPIATRRDHVDPVIEGAISKVSDEDAEKSRVAGGGFGGPPENPDSK